MKRFLSLVFVFAVTLAVAMPASAAVTFSDVPANGWATPAVYDLVKLGVTTGYPDGTYRGKKNVTRYELAQMLSKLAKAMGSDVKDDIAALQAQVAKLKQPATVVGGTAISGSYQADVRFSNLLSSGTRTALTPYRLKLATTPVMNDKGSVVVNLDTMDYGWANTTAPNFAEQLIDITSSINLDWSAIGFSDPIVGKVVMGPGNIQNTSNYAGAFPQMVGVTYIRPYSGLSADTKLWGADVSGTYVMKQRTASETAYITMLSGALGYTFNEVPMVETLKLTLSGDYVNQGIISTGTRDIRGAIALAAPLSDKVEVSGKLAAGSSASKGMMLAGDITLNDAFDTGTVVKVMASKIGSEFLTSNAVLSAAEFDLAGFDTFSRPFINGTVNLGGEVVQNVTDDIKLIGKGDVRLGGNYKYEAPSGRITAQGGVSYAVAPNTSLSATYLLHQDKATSKTTDMAAVGLLYNF